MYVDSRVLDAIMQRDPDGTSPTPPTDAQYAAHAAWAIATYGQAAWDRYCAGPWERDPDV